MKAIRLYKLNKYGEPEAVRNIWAWALWMTDANRIVRRQNVTPEIVVSTVFLGIDHNYSDSGSPILWETMVFGGPEEIEGMMKRCSGSREQALAMHVEIIERVEALLALQK